VSDHAVALGAAAGTRGPGAARRTERALWIFVALAAAVLVGTATTRLQANPLLGAVAVSLVLVAAHRTLLAWQTLLAAVLLVILFVPIRRYTVGGGLPFELEPYRALIAAVLACWLCAVAADPKVRWRPTGLELPMVAFLVAILISMALNVSEVSAVGSTVVKQVTFFVSYFLVAYFVASVVRPGEQMVRVVKLLVAGGALLAVLSLIEWRTGTNLFNWYGRVAPFLHFQDLGEHVQRGTGVRALGSAQHPIALGAALVMLIPLSVYLHRLDGRVRWLVSGGVLTLGALATGSRTATLMLIVLLVVFIAIKPTETMRLVPWLLPLTIVIQIAMPGTLGTFRAILQPSYVIQEQSTEMGSGSGRIADLGPSLDQWSQNPLFGQGFGTRVSSEGIGEQQTRGQQTAQVLDDQWLGLLLELGIAGVAALLWLYSRAIRRLARLARSDPGPDSWLATALAASLTSFAIGMLTFDAFAFIQVTFLSFVLLGLMAIATRPEAARAAVRRRGPTAPAPQPQAS
jgi:O-antigen ligase